MPIPRIVIAAWRPKPGKEIVLLAELRDHHPLLRSEGLATERPAIVMRAPDGTILEVFEWASPAAIAEAHGHARVQAMWARFAACTDPVPLSEVAGLDVMFAEFEPVSLEQAPIIQPDPDHRAE